MTTINREKDPVLEKAFEEIEKRFGKNAVYYAGDNNKADIKVMPSGILSFDVASNLGGLPRGRLIEFFGLESSGKTTMALLSIAAAQKRGEKCAFIDAEQAMDPTWARKLGVDWDNLIFSQPDTAEKALGIAEVLIRSNKVSIIVIDSVAALVPEAELQEDSLDIGFPLKAKMLSTAFRKLTAHMANSKYGTVICLNHKMEKIKPGYGDKSTTPGGKALKFYSSMRIEFVRTGWIKDNDENKIGMEVLIKFIKNKCATPYGSMSYEFLSKNGIDLTSETIKLATKFEILTLDGKDYIYNGNQLASGERRLKSFLNKEENINLLSELKAKVYEKIVKLSEHDTPDGGPVTDEMPESELNSEEETAE